MGALHRFTWLTFFTSCRTLFLRRFLARPIVLVLGQADTELQEAYQLAHRVPAHMERWNATSTSGGKFLRGIRCAGSEAGAEEKA